MPKFKTIFQKYVAQPIRKARKALATAGMALGALLAGSGFASAAPNTGNTDIDTILTEFESGFEVAKSGFTYLAIAAVSVTLLVVAFFWLRGKFKQAVSGA